jgi:hypothetical protein
VHVGAVVAVAVADTYCPALQPGGDNDDTQVPVSDKRYPLLQTEHSLLPDVIHDAHWGSGQLMHTGEVVAVALVATYCAALHPGGMEVEAHEPLALNR